MKNHMILIVGAVVLGAVLFVWFLYQFANVPEPDWNEDIPKNPVEDFQVDTGAIDKGMIEQTSPSNSLESGNGDK